MTDPETWLAGLGAGVVLLPLAQLAALGVPPLFGVRLGERFITRVVQWTTGLGLVLALAVGAGMLAVGDGHVTLSAGRWVELGHDYHFAVKFLFDGLSVAMVVLSFTLCGVIGAFSARYLHREPGFHRFHVLYAVFVVGMTVASLAGTIETLFAGWELVGLSSALLVAFFHERRLPVRNGLWVWSVYRVSDAALLLAAVVLHHVAGEGDFDKLLGTRSWSEGVVPLTAGQVWLIGGLLLVAAAGKSALVPFSGWLPRAMEGPTPSSAIFYGALSVHLGAFLLLRLGPLLEASPGLSVAVAALGLATAGYAALVGSVQTDVKSALSFASLAQVGLIVAEIGFGLRYLALAHLIGHASLRTLQFLQASSILQQHRSIENAVGGRLPPGTGVLSRLVPDGVRRWVYLWSLERGYLDAFLADYLVAPFLRLFVWCDRVERWWTDFLTGDASRESDAVELHPEEEEVRV